MTKLPKINARGPVSRVLCSAERYGEAATIPLGRRLPSASSDQPGRRGGTAPYAAPIRSCTRWGLPCRPCRQDRGALLPHPFDLTRPKPGGILSVALSLTPEGAAGRYPAPLFRGARTFLGEASFDAAARSPGGANIGRNARLFESVGCWLRDGGNGWKGTSANWREVRCRC